MHKIRHVLGEERGQSLVEFTLSASILLMSIFGILECARALYIYHFVSYAAQQATRYAIVRGAHWTASCSTTSIADCNATGTDIQKYVQGIAPPGVTSSSITVTATWPAATVAGASSNCSSTASTDGCLIKVTVQYPFSFIGPFLPKTAMSFSATSVETVQE